MLPPTTDVLVIGAGPTGLMMAVELVRRGVDVVLIDRHERPLSWDRATVLHARSLELFDALGLVEAVVERAVVQRHVHTYSRGEQLGTIDLSLNDSRFPYNLGLSEEVTESVLSAHLEALGGAVTRGAKLVDLAAPADGRVTATVELEGATADIVANWVVGCDGFYGPTRRLAGVDAQVLDENRPWVVFDATVEPWRRDRSDIHVFWDDPQTALTALPNDRWRVYVRSALVGDEVVAASLQTVRRYEEDARFIDLGTVSAFECHTRIADRYRSGHVLLAGDAAHVCSPAQGHGMNGGLQDAANLAWKLALVVHGQASVELLDTYERERRPIALDYVQQAIDLDPLMLVREDDEVAARNDALRTQLADPDNVHRDAVAEAEMDIDLSSSPIVHGEGAGRTLPADVEVVAADGVGQPLAQRAVSAEHTAVLIAGEAIDEALLDVVRRGVDGEAQLVDRHVIVRTTNDLDALRPGEVAIDASARLRLGVEPAQVVLLLVRPDGYVGLRASDDHGTAVARYSSSLFAR